MQAPTAPRRIRFGRFELDVRTGELLKDARRLRVPDQSIQILQALLERAGDVVTREELRDRLWPAGTFVDFDHGVNSAMRRLRDALGDSADRPKLIETLPRRGYRFIGVVDTVAAETQPAPSVPDAAPVPAPVSDARNPAPVPRSRPVAWWTAAALAVAIGGAAVLITGVWSRGADAAATPWSAMPTRLTFEDGLQTDPSFSPDGQSFVYASNVTGNFDLYTRAVAGGDAVPITTHPAHDWQPDWSPNGSVAFRSERDGGGIFVVPVTGGAARKVADFGYRPQWSPDGRALVFTRSTLYGSGSRLHVLMGLDGAPRQLSTTAASSYGWMRDSRRIMVLSSGVLPPVPRLVDIDAETGTLTEWTFDAGVSSRLQDEEIFIASGEKLQWHADGRSLFFVGLVRGARNVWRIDVDAAARRVTAGPDRVTSLPDASTFSLARAGDRLAFDGSTRTAQLWSFDLNEAGQIIEDSRRLASLEAAHAEHPALSSDGAWLASIQTRPGGRRLRALVVRELATDREETIREVRDDGGIVLAPQWSYSGTRLSYTLVTRSLGTLERQLRVFDMASRRDEPLTSPQSSVNEFAGGWSRDDRFVVSSSPRYIDGRVAIALLRLAAAPQAERTAEIVTSVEQGSLFQPSMSPDRRWLAFRAVNLPGMSVGQIAVVSAEGGDPSQWIMATHGLLGADKPRWSARGDRIYFALTEGAMLNVWSVGFDGARGAIVGEPRQETAYADPAHHLLPNILMFDVAIGGNRMVVPIVRATGGIWLASERGGR